MGYLNKVACSKNTWQVYIVANPRVFTLHIREYYCVQSLQIGGKSFISSTPVFLKLGSATGCHVVRGRK